MWSFQCERLQIDSFLGVIFFRSHPFLEVIFSRNKVFFSMPNHLEAKHCSIRKWATFIKVTSFRSDPIFNVIINEMTHLSRWSILELSISKLSISKWFIFSELFISKWLFWSDLFPKWPIFRVVIRLIFRIGWFRSDLFLTDDFWEGFPFCEMTFQKLASVF